MVAPAHPRHLVLVGAMGSGKTTIGRRLADLVQRPFADNDAALRRATGRTPRELVEQAGLGGLHRAERTIALELLDRPPPHVLALAASTIEEPTVRAALAARGWVVWLDADDELLAARAQEGTHRPLAAGDVDEVLRRHRSRRAHFAEVADLVLDVGARPAGEIAAEVVRAWSDGEGVRSVGRARSPGCEDDEPDRR